MRFLYKQIKWAQHHDRFLTLEIQHCSNTGRYTIDGVRLCTTYR